MLGSPVISEPVPVHTGSGCLGVCAYGCPLCAPGTRTTCLAPGCLGTIAGRLPRCSSALQTCRGCAPHRSAKGLHRNQPSGLTKPTLWNPLRSGAPNVRENMDELLVAGRKNIIVAPTLDETVKIRDPALAGLVYPFPGTASHNGSPATMCTLAPGNRPVAAR